MMQSTADAAGVESEALEQLEATEGVHERSLERARTEDMSVVVPSAGLAVVTNEKHDDPSAHTYAVNVIDGSPVKCSCPADRNYPTACKHRLFVAMRPAIMAATEVTDQEREAADREPELLADGGEEHVDACGDARCEGLATDAKRPELSFPCFERWSQEDHDWSDEIAEREPVPASAGESANIVLERALVEEQRRKEQERAEADREARTTPIENDRRLGVIPRGF